MVLPGIPVDAVQWSIDHPATTITVHVNLAFYPVNMATLAPWKVARVVARIHDYWDGLYYKCYRLIVMINPLVIDKPSDAPDNYLDVGLDGGMVPIRSGTMTYEGPNIFHDEDPLSDSETCVPARGWDWLPSRSTVWASNSKVQGTFAHEFAHVIGISDGYINKGACPKVPCHSTDLMYRHSSSEVSPQMVAQAVHRSGLDVSGVKCPVEFRTNTTSLNLGLAEIKDVSIQARCEDYPAWSDDPGKRGAAKFTGDLKFTAGYLAGQDWSAARGVLDKFGVPADPNLTTDHTMDDKITFDLPQPGCAEKDAETNGVEMTFTITVPGATLIGYYTRETDSKVPRMTRPMVFNTVSTETFLPGPPLEGRFIDASGPGGATAP